MSDIVRDHCVICGGDALKPFLEIESFAVFQGCVDFPRKADETAPMQWSECSACGSAQIATLPALERIYQAGHATGLGAAWARHHAAFAGFIRAHASGACVDIGGGSGTLAIAYRKAGGTSPWTILEPNALRAPNLPPDIDLVDGFLEQDDLIRSGARNAVMCHMFEHAVDLRAALQALTNALPQDGRICLAWPELESWTRKGLAGALNFEHGVYLGMPHLLALFAAFGWSPVARQRWDENDSWFLAFARAEPRTEQIPRGDGAAAVSAYFTQLRNLAVSLMDTARRHQGDIFLMPASIYAQMLLCLGLDETRFSALLDNSAVKQGNRLYGTSLAVCAPSAMLARARTPLVILNGGAHDAEIAAGLREIRPDVEITQVSGLQTQGNDDRAKIAPAS